MVHSHCAQYQVQLPAFPPKRALGNTKEKFVQQREADLQTWVSPLRLRLLSQSRHPRFREACRVVVVGLALQHHFFRYCRALNALDQSSDEGLRGAVLRSGVAAPALLCVAETLLLRFCSPRDGLFGSDECSAMWRAAQEEDRPDEVAAQVGPVVDKMLSFPCLCRLPM